MVLGWKRPGRVWICQAKLLRGKLVLLSLFFYEEDKYDVLIIDCAPTGQSLSLLTYSEKLNMIADTILPLVQSINSIFGSFISKKTSVPKPKDAVFEEFSKLAKKLSHLDEILHNQSTTSIRIVTTPEQIVLDEAKRNYTWMQLYNFNVDAIYINKIYPEEALKDYFETWEKIQKENLHSAKKSFFKQKIFMLELQKEEVHGIETLEKITKLLYGNIDASEIFSQNNSFYIEEQNGTHIFIIPLPFAKQDEIFVKKEKGDLILSWLNETRRFHLPEKLRRRKISSFYYEDGKLKIYMDYE